MSETTEETKGPAGTAQVATPAVTPGENDGAAPAEASREEKARAEQTFRGEHVVVGPLPRPLHAIALTLPGSLPFDDTDENAPAAELREFAERLAATNVAAREQSLARLADWFPGYDFDAAAQATDDRRFTLLQIGSVLYEHLDALDTVEQILNTRALAGNQVQFSHGEKQGGEPPRVIRQDQPNMRRVQVGPLINALDQQWTTILNGIDQTDSKISSVVEDLERVYGCRVNTNVYISWGHALGFGPHWDQHDTIIVPAAGSKHWKVYEPTMLSPLRPWTGPEVSPRPVWEGNIEPGMCLVIPRGWGHEVGGSDDLAIHYTIGINRITAQDAIQRLSSEGGTRPLLRADMAYDPAKTVSSYEKSLHDDGVLVETVEELATPEMLARALATYRARMPLRMFPRLFDAWVGAGLGEWQGVGLRLPAPAGIQLMAITPQMVVVAVADQQCDLTHDAFEVVLQLADCRTHSFDALPVTDTERRSAICAELVRAGLVEVSS